MRLCKLERRVGERMNCGRAIGRGRCENEDVRMARRKKKEARERKGVRNWRKKHVG